MDRIGSPWSRHQWAGTPEELLAIDAADEPASHPWNFSQWVGDPGHDHPRVPFVPSHPDGRGGFSGFGVPDSGGMRWATGYDHAVPAELVALDGIDAEGEVA